MNNQDVENKGVVIDENYLEESLNTKKSKKSKVFLILAIVFFSIAMLCNIFDIILCADIYHSVLNPPEQTGPINVSGLEKGIGLVLYIVFMIPTVIAMILSLVFSCISLKWHKTVALIFIGVSLLTFAVHLILMIATVNHEPVTQALASIL